MSDPKFRIGTTVQASSALSPEAIDAGTDELLLFVGKCINAWSMIEWNMAHLFMSLHDKLDDPGALRHVFSGVVSFEVRLAMLNLTVQNDKRLSPRFITSWNALFNKLSKSARKRNEVAHFTIAVNHEDIVNPKIRLYPFWSGMTDPGLGLSAKDLAERLASFHALSKRVERFWWHILLVRKQRVECHMPITDPDHLLDNPFISVQEEP